MTTNKTSSRILRQLLLGSAALSLTLWMPQGPSPRDGLIASAHAQGQGSGGQGQGGGGQRGGSSGERGGSSTHGSGTTTSNPGMGQGGQVGGQGHNGQGGSTGTESGEEGTSPDKKGPQFGGGANTRKPESGTSGGRPVWAKEGIPAVELGRLSVARAPAQVLDHAFSEVVNNWSTTGTTVLTLTAEGQPTLTMTVAELYSKSAAEFANLVTTYYDSILRVDSPLENLALLKDLATNHTTALTGVTPASTDDLAGIFLGSASDKTLPVTADTVTAIYTILGLPTLTPAETAAIAADAEAVRVAISTGHG